MTFFKFNQSTIIHFKIDKKQTKQFEMHLCLYTLAEIPYGALGYHPDDEYCYIGMLKILAGFWLNI